MSSQIVERVLARYPTLLVVHKSEFEMRRRQFLPHIAHELPGGEARWGALWKSSTKMANDVLVDKTTDLHYDVLTGKNHGDDQSIPQDFIRVEAAWKNQGPIKTPNHPNWKWISIEEANIDPLPGEPQEPPPPPPDNDLVARVNTLEQQIALLTNRLQVTSDSTNDLSIRQGTYEEAQHKLSTRVDALENPNHPDEFEIAIDGETEKTGPRWLEHSHPIHLTGKARKI